MQDRAAFGNPYHVRRANPDRRETLIARCKTWEEARSRAAAANRRLLEKVGPPARAPFVFYFADAPGRSNPGNYGLGEIDERRGPQVGLVAPVEEHGRVGSDRRYKGVRR